MPPFAAPEAATRRSPAALRTHCLSCPGLPSQRPARAPPLCSAALSLSEEPQRADKAGSGAKPLKHNNFQPPQFTEVVFEGHNPNWEECHKCTTKCPWAPSDSGGRGPSPLRWPTSKVGLCLEDSLKFLLICTQEFNEITEGAGESCSRRGPLQASAAPVGQSCFVHTIHCSDRTWIFLAQNLNLIQRSARADRHTGTGG